MINPDDGQWLTYREAAVVLGLTPEGVRSLARRKGWSRQTPNEIGGVARVLLPTDLHRRERPDPTDATTGVLRRDTVAPPSGLPSRDSSENGPVNGAVDRAGFPAGELAVEVALLRERIADKDIHIADLRSRLDAADRRLDAAMAAERKAADEASALRAAIDQRRAWGLLRRLYAALRRI